MIPSGVEMAPPPLTKPQELLVAFIAAGPEDLDPIRIVKGVFVFCQEAAKEWLDPRAIYDFEPYSWGPFSFDLYRDLNRLRDLGYVEARQHPSATWSYYQATASGQQAAAEIRQRMNPQLVAYLGEVRRFVLSLPFRDLLKAIYRKYPQFATNSVFRS